MNTRRVLRSPSLKRKSKAIPLSNRVTLERVLGFTVQSNAALCCDQNTGTVAYPAGCVVVLYNVRKGRYRHIFNVSKKTITCLAFCREGRHLATGECGHQPMVRVWDVEERVQICEFQGHKFGINCVAFSPNLKYLVSVGSQHDMTVSVWNWKTKVTDVDFTEDGGAFVTVGNRHVKFWYLDASSKTRINTTVPLQGRQAILGDQKNNFFRAVVCGRSETKSSTFAITHSGLLCEFNDKRLLDKWVELRTTSASCIAASRFYIFIGCAAGVVRVFDAASLHFVCSMPRPHHLGLDVANGPEIGSELRYPDTTGVVVDDENQLVTCIYNDHSLYVWDISNVHNMGKVRSFLYHSSCIWGLEVYPRNDVISAALPAGSFLTCGADDTVRIWNLDPNMSTDTSFKRNAYSNELLKVLYADPDHQNLLDVEFNPAGKKDKTDTGFAEKNGVRCVRASPDGQALAAGDRVGNVRVYDLKNMSEVKFLEAHDGEVLCLEFTKPDMGVRLLATASRDRFIHVFDRDQDYGLIQTLDDHSSAITSVHFAQTPEAQLMMISCGADKSILFRTAQQEPEFQFQLHRHLVGKTTLYDMVVDPTDKFVATACQDRNIRIYNMKNGKQKKCYKGAIGDDGSLIKVQLDPSGAYAATSCSDKNIAMLDFFTGEVVAAMSGHSEVVTGVTFTLDYRRLISVCGDGCIFVWRLPQDFQQHMANRSADVTKRPLGAGDHANSGDAALLGLEHEPKILKPAKDNNANEAKYQMNVGSLPTWAKKQVMSDATTPGLPAPTAPRGRWAQRVENSNIVVKSMLDESTISLALNDAYGEY